jgi:hypothetical protein
MTTELAATTNDTETKPTQPVAQINITQQFNKKAADRPRAITPFLLRKATPIFCSGQRQPTPTRSWPITTCILDSFDC